MRRAASLLLLAATATACASAGRGSGSCRSTTWRSGGALSAVVDSAELATGLAPLAAAGTGLAIASLAYDSVGALQGVSVHADGASASLLQSVEDAVRGAAHSSGDQGGHAYLVLTDGGDLRPRRVAGFQACAPTFRDRDRLASLLRTEAGILRVDRRVAVLVRVFVQEDGTTGETVIQRGSGDRSVDEAAVRVVRRATFVPGMIEGFPIGVWAAFPITFSPVAGR